MQELAKPAQTHPSIFTEEDAANMAKAMCSGFRCWDKQYSLRLCREAIKAFNEGKNYYIQDEGLGWEGDRRYFFRFTLKDGVVTVEHGYYLFIDDDEVPYFDVITRYTHNK